jgi:hypothetical protein
MPCYTKVLVTLEDTRWNREARKKLGFKLEGQLTEEEATKVRIEAGKLKVSSIVKMQSPTAMISGLQVGLKQLRIQVDL